MVTAFARSVGGRCDHQGRVPAAGPPLPSTVCDGTTHHPLPVRPTGEVR